MHFQHRPFRTALLTALLFTGASVVLAQDAPPPPPPAPTTEDAPPPPPPPATVAQDAPATPAENTADTSATAKPSPPTTPVPTKPAVKYDIPTVQMVVTKNRPPHWLKANQYDTAPLTLTCKFSVFHPAPEGYDVQFFFVMKGWGYEKHALIYDVCEGKIPMGTVGECSCVAPLPEVNHMIAFPGDAFGSKTHDGSTPFSLDWPPDYTVMFHGWICRILVNGQTLCVAASNESYSKAAKEHAAYFDAAFALSKKKAAEAAATPTPTPTVAPAF